MTSLTSTVPQFNDIKVSTKTIIGVSDLTIPINELYKVLPIKKYIVIPLLLFSIISII